MAKEFDIFNIPLNQPKTQLKDYIVFLYAPPKWGKSSFGARFGNPLFVAFEPGYKALPVRPVDVIDWKYFVKQVVDPLEKAVQEGKTLPYDYIVIDTVDKASAMCREYVCKREGIAHESDLEWGKGFAYVKDEYDKQMLRICKLGIGIIQISHAELKTFKPKGKDEYTKMVPSIPKGIREIVLPLSNLILYGDLKTTKNDDGELVEERVMYCRETADFEAGCHLVYMPSHIDFGKSPQEGYNNFVKAFNEAIFKEFGVDNNKLDATEHKQTEEIKETIVDPPVKEPETKPGVPIDVKPIEKQGEPDKEIDTQDLSNILKEVNTKSVALYKSKAKTTQELVDIIEQCTGVKKVSSIKDAKKAQILLDKLIELEDVA